MKKFKSKIIKMRKIFAVLTTIFLIVSNCMLPVFAADSNTGVESSLKTIVDLFVTVVKIVGFILSIWGVVEFATAQNSHDGASKLKGVSMCTTGLIIFFAKEILTFAGVSI